jgi:glycosyltransferase involved in cell wall biosynthesis
MRLVLIADVFPPLRSSGAVQLRDLSKELVRQGHDVTVMVAAPELDKPWHLDTLNGARVLRLRTPKTKDVSYACRALGEFAMSFAMLRNLKRSPCANEVWDGVVWYSPTIFLGPIAKVLKSRSRCPSYLIIRDIFPEWAVDMGLMGRGLPYRFFKTVANYQYSVADIIGVQTPGNLSYFRTPDNRLSAKLEVLHNWLAAPSSTGCSISISNTHLKGRKIFVYAGNMGIAQGMGILLELADQLKERADIGFVFVGRGTDAQRLRSDAQSRELDNVLFFDEIDPDEVPGLYAQCHIGLVALDARHKTHNIPGKFLSYMQSSLPVLASVNDGNDLVGLIQGKAVGAVCTNNSASTLAQLAIGLLFELDNDAMLPTRCTQLAKAMFDPAAAVEKIISALEYERQNIHSTHVKRPDFCRTAIAEEKTTSEYSSKL